MVYLIKDNKVQSSFDNVVDWGYNYVEYGTKARCKFYCNEDEYFTDKELEENIDNIIE